MRAGIAAVLALLTWGCGKPVSEVIARKPDVPPPAAEDHERFLNLLDGVVVTSRTGELDFAHSALNAVDATGSSVWTSPPKDPQQELILALPARTRLRRVGVSTGVSAKAGHAVSKVAFETSADGQTFEPLQTISVTKAADHQLLDAKPAEAIAVRVKLLESLRPPNSDVGEILLEGEELEPPQRGPLTGTWKLNNLTADLHERGDRVFGTVKMDPPMLLDGAWDGRVAKFAWVRGTQYGVGLFTIDRSGRYLSGFWWYREAIPPYLGTPWFGTKSSGSAAAKPTIDVAATSLRRRKSVPLYAFRFDAKDQLLDPAWAVEQLKLIIDQYPGKQFALVAHDIRGEDADDDQRATETRIGSIRAALVQQGMDVNRFVFTPAGRQRSRDPAGMPQYIYLHSRVELELLEK